MDDKLGQALQRNTERGHLAVVDPGRLLHE
jgi:hypothetical protein